MRENLTIDASNISKCFGNFTALRDVTLSVRQGEIYGFIGKNGAGKTTFMRIVCGLMKPNAGTLEVKKHIAFLPQNVRFRDTMSASEALRFFAGLKGTNAQESIRFADELDIDPGRMICSMSPGQQRKLQLVITTIGSPDVLVLDEPTAGLDPSGTQQVRSIIQTLHRKGCTVFISSHVLMELENLCDTIAVIEKGELRYQGACGAAYEIETEGMNAQILETMPPPQRDKFSVKEGLLIAGVEKREVPAVLQFLYERNVKVFGVKRQGIETLYNSLVQEVK